jgi:RNA polymerase sigma-70 factor (sigma-E family)
MRYEVEGHCEVEERLVVAMPQSGGGNLRPSGHPGSRHLASLTSSAVAPHADDRDLDEDFAEFVANRQRSLVGFAHLLCGNHHDAQDMVQTALARTFLKWPRLRQDSYNVEAYVRRAIINESTSLWRRAWKRREHSTDAPPERIQHSEADEIDDATWEYVVRLPPRQRAVIALRYYEDLSVADTAAALHCSEGTVKSQTFKALGNLRKALAETSWDIEGIEGEGRSRVD